MNDTPQCMFSQKQVIEALLKLQGISEGKWTLVIQFGFGAVTAGPDEENLAPTAMVGVTGFGLKRADVTTKGTIVDASSFTQTNPKRKKPPLKAAKLKKPAAKK